MQHTLTPTGAVSMRFSMFDLMANMFCHVAASSWRDMLESNISDELNVILRHSCTVNVLVVGSWVYVDWHWLGSRTTS
jgi:hypothetical protein